VLVIGNPAFMPWLSDVCRDISSVRKPGELAMLIKEGEQFDKVILPRESIFSPDLVPLVAALLKDAETERGIFVVFPPGDGWTESAGVDLYFPEGRSWELDSTFGQVQLFELAPTSWRMIHG
jgi:hypothetical protein